MHRIFRFYVMMMFGVSLGASRLPAYEKSLLRNALLSLPQTFACAYKGEDLAAAFPEFSDNGPPLWLLNTYRHSALPYCYVPSELASLLRRVHTESMSECAERGLEAVPLWVLLMRSSSPEVLPNLREYSSERRYRESLGSKYRHRESLRLDYYRNEEGKLVRDGVSAYTVAVEEAFPGNPLLFQAAPPIHELDLRNMKEWDYFFVKRSTDWKERLWQTEYGLLSFFSYKISQRRNLRADGDRIERIAARLRYERLESSGIRPDIECEEGYCSFSRPSGWQTQIFLDDLFKGKRNWKASRFAQIYSYENEPTELVATVEYLRADCKLQNGKRTCRPIPPERMLDPLAECVTSDMNDIFDRIGLENGLGSAHRAVGPG